MPQPCIQQTAFKVHQLADNEVAQIFLSRQFRCPKTKRRAYVQGEQQNYHVVLLSIFVLAFFLILEWAGPLSVLSSFSPVQAQQPPATSHFLQEQWNAFSTLRPGVSNDMVFVYKSPP